MTSIRLIGRYTDNTYIGLTDNYKKVVLSVEQLYRYSLSGVSSVNYTFINGKLRGLGVDLRRLPRVSRCRRSG